MSKDKYTSIFSPQMETIVFITLQITQRAQFWKLGDILAYPPGLARDIRSRDMFKPIARERKDLMDYNLGNPHF